VQAKVHVADDGVSVTRLANGKVRVLIVAPSLRFLGGQAVQALRLMASLRVDEEVEVDYLEVDPRLPAPFDRLQRIPILRTLVTSAMYLSALILRVGKYDTVHAFSASYWSFLLAPVPAILVGRLFGKRVILNYHSGEADDHLTRWGWHARPLIRLADLTVVPTTYLVEVFSRHGLSAIAVPNHIAVPPVPPQRRALVVPRFFSNRNFESHYSVVTVIEAFAIVQCEFPSAELVVTGGGALRPSLEKRVQELGITGCRFTGPVQPEEMIALYNDADVYVNASLIDNMPLSILEAYAVGLPVVTSDAGGIPWIAKDGETALVVVAGNVEALAGAMRDAIVHWQAALQRAERARAFVTEMYAWPAVRAKWLHAYASNEGEVANARGAR
jgi:glycosyltransferase involved in cell wall biosynthesis